MNPFEQGEVWHPGILNLSQSFFDKAGLNVELNKLVTYSKTSVFSNYIIAKPKFWHEWITIADNFFEIVERKATHEFNQLTSYGCALNQTSMKTFIQERFASVILARGGYNVISIDDSQAPIFTRLFNDDVKTRKMLQTCDLLKEKYCITKDYDFLNMYFKIRKDIDFKSPQM